MLGSAFPDPKRLPPHDNPYLLLENVADTLSASDITFGNLEGSFLDRGDPWKKCRDTTVCYLFRMPERYVSALTSSGFDILSVANNHFGDFGVRRQNKNQTYSRFSGYKLCRSCGTPLVNFQKRFNSLWFLRLCTKLQEQ